MCSELEKLGKEDISVKKDQVAKILAKVFGLTVLIGTISIFSGLLIDQVTDKFPFFTIITIVSSLLVVLWLDLKIIKNSLNGKNSDRV